MKERLHLHSGGEGGGGGVVGDDWLENCSTWYGDCSEIQEGR